MAEGRKLVVMVENGAWVVTGDGDGRRAWVVVVVKREGGAGSYDGVRSVDSGESG